MIGGIVLLAWLWLICHATQIVPALMVAASSNVYAGRSGGFAVYILILPLLSAAMLIYPQFFVNHFNVYTGMDNEPLLNDGFWRMVGYFILLLSWALWELFHSL